MSSSLSWAERLYMVETALAAELPLLTLPAPTRVVADRIARRLGWESGEVAEVLFKIAPRCLNASHDGPEQKRFGRTFQGWRWHPQPYAQPEQKGEPAAVSAAPSPPETPPLRSAAPSPGTPAYRAMRLAEVDTILAAKPIDDGKFPLGEGEEEW